MAICAALLVNAQGPFPPRLSIPGAVPVSGPVLQQRPQFRNEKLVRVRRPIQVRQQTHTLPAVTPRIVEDKPVTEAPEDEAPDVFLPTLLREQQLAQAQQQQFQQQANAFFSSDPNALQDALSTNHQQQQQLLLDEVSPIARFPERHSPAAPAHAVFKEFGFGSSFGNDNSAGSQRFGLERPQAILPAPVTVRVQPTSAPAPQPQPAPVQRVARPRQPIREHRPQYEAQAAPAPLPQRPRPKPIQSRPNLIEENRIQDDRDNNQQNSRKRPVAQTIRKWREENEDGSITWGYENDDGSFKEEIIGTDCVTK